MVSLQPIIHEAITENPDPAEFMPVEVTSAFPKGAQSRLTSAEQVQIDKLIEEVPDVNDALEINYWREIGDREVYLEGWIDKCLAATGFPPMEGGEWDEKIQYMVRDTHRTLIAKQEDGSLSPPEIVAKLPLTLIEGGFREFEAGEKSWLYGVTWGVYKQANEVGKEARRIGAMGRGEMESLAKDALEHNPLSAHCEAVLAKPPKCFDFRGIRAFVMCKAWDILEKEKRTKLPVSEAWQEARKVCVRK